MKITLRISLLLNLAMFAGLIFLLTNRRNPAAVPAPIVSEDRPPAQTVEDFSPPKTSDIEPIPFRWSQLLSAKDYRTYIANLRAVGCPEATIEDIVRGDTDRAFSWERRQLGLDGSGAGPWSQPREMQLVASLLGGQPPVGTTTRPQGTEHSADENNSDEVAQTSVPPPDPKTGSPSCPLFLQNPNWSGMGFTADQQATIAQVRQQFQNEIGSLNQNPGGAASQNVGTAGTAGSASTNPNDTSALTRWQNALQNANNQLRDLLGAQGYMAYEQQQYYAWYQPQVVAANASGEPLTINPDAFSLK
jgi:hypothetical protein